jgi:hypothetical protein
MLKVDGGFVSRAKSTNPKKNSFNNLWIDDCYF